MSSTTVCVAPDRPSPASSTSHRLSRAPSAARRRAIPAPIPETPPVTIAVRPSNRCAMDAVLLVAAMKAHQGGGGKMGEEHKVPMELSDPGWRTLAAAVSLRHGRACPYGMHTSRKHPQNQAFD